MAISEEGGSGKGVQVAEVHRMSFSTMSFLTRVRMHMRGRVIDISVVIFLPDLLCWSVLLWTQNEHFGRSRPPYEFNLQENCESEKRKYLLLCTSRSCKSDL